MNVRTDGFPPALLAQPAAERLAYFTTKVIAHPHLKEVHDAVLQAIHQPVGAAILFVFGPTGVGKTTLRRRIEHQLIAEFLPHQAAQPGRLPVVGVEAISPENGSFNWKDHYSRLLHACHEPLVDAKVDYQIRGVGQNRDGQLVIGPSVVVAELRSAVEACLRARQPAAVLIDEAQHLKKMTSGRRVLDQMDTIKSLASTTNIVHILFGTYELLSLTHLSGQLSRRSLEIHFPRYRFDDPDQRQMFLRVVYTFQRQLPLAEEPDLVALGEYLYERCVGCVGVLKSWLTQALALALAENSPTMTRSLLERSALSIQRLVRMAREIADGEAMLHAQGDHTGNLRNLLGMDGPSPTSPLSPPAAHQGRRKQPAGKRAPGRDPVGEVTP